MSDKIYYNQLGQPITIKEIQRLSDKFGSIDLTHRGEKDKSVFLGQLYKTTELYRTKNFTCHSLSKT